jgi:hypothetical protein
MASLGPIYVIAKPLYAYRFHSTTATVTRRLTTVERMYRCVDRVRSGQDYAAILEDPEPMPTPPPDPRAVRSLASPRLWAGEQPGIPPAWWLRGSWHPIPAALHALILGTWGEVSPKSLRWALRALVKSRDLVASLRIQEGDVVRWTPVPDRASRLSPALAPETSGK